MLHISLRKNCLRKISLFIICIVITDISLIAGCSGSKNSKQGGQQKKTRQVSRPKRRNKKRPNKVISTASGYSEQQIGSIGSSASKESDSQLIGKKRKKKRKKRGRSRIVPNGMQTSFEEADGADADIFNPMHDHLTSIVQRHDVQGENRTPLHYAAINGEEDFLIGMLEAIKNSQYHYDVCMADFKGATVLHYAAANDLRRFIQTLFALFEAEEVGVNATDRSMNTPLDYAQSEEVKEFLKQHGAIAAAHVGGNRDCRAH